MVPIKKTDVFQNIIQQITNLIESNQFHEGDRLPSERDLADKLQVSRTSVRQALKVLESTGRVEIRVGSGTFLRAQSTVDISQPTTLEQLIEGGVTKEFLRNLIVARTAIERTIFEEYAYRANKSGIKQLEQLIAENKVLFSDSLIDNDESGLDLSFEKKVAELTQNSILITMQTQIHNLWVLAWRQYGYTPERSEVLHEEHVQILDALASRNVTKVADLIVRHVDKEID